MITASKPSASRSLSANGPRLIPPLRKPEPSLRKIASPSPAADPPKLRKERRPRTAFTFFCRQCDARQTGYQPPSGWLDLRRRVVPGSLGPAKHSDSMKLGYYCSWACFAAALPRLEALCRSLNERGVGLRRLAPGEMPPALPPPTVKGGPN